MSSTNKTLNYNLPQYVADDKPTYLEDFNQTMLNIDTALKEIDVKATSTIANVENALETSHQANETANQANETALHAQTDATNAIATSNNAKSDTDKNTVEVNKIDNWLQGNLTPNPNCHTTINEVSYKYNKKLGLLSIYGSVVAQDNVINDKVFVSLPDFLTPLINHAVFVAGNFTNKDYQQVSSTIRFNSSGSLEFRGEGVKEAYMSFLIAVNDWFE